MVFIDPREVQRLRRQCLTIVVAEDVNGGRLRVAEGDEDVGPFGRGELYAVIVPRGGVVVVEVDVVADVGAFAVIVGGAFGGETGFVVRAGEGA